ncbi:MAG: nucleoside kinase, partial [Spirochaetaceae bacterium]|nr:nucleoside kinase [Spirochaetaceae bacterium]
MNTALVMTLPGGKTVTVPIGTAAETLAEHFGPLNSPLAAIRVSNEIEPLSARLEINAAVEPVTLESVAGTEIYRRSLAFLLAVAAEDLYPERSLVIGHSLGNSYYYTLALRDSLTANGITENGVAENDASDDGLAENGGDRRPGVTAEDIRALENRMRVLVRDNIPVGAGYIAWSEAAELFEKNSQKDTLRLLERRSGAKVRVNRAGSYVNLYFGPLVPRTGVLSVFQLMPYHEGFLLRFPGQERGLALDPFTDSPRIFEVYREYKKWGRIVGVHSAGDLNQLVATRKIRDFIRIAEAFQARKISDIASRIYDRRDEVKAVLIAGPSSSGKTTTAKRLSIELMVLGIEPIAVSLDDFYVGIDKTPRDEKGKPDFEALEALDVPLLNDLLLRLFDGGETVMPSFDFKSGRRRDTPGATLKMGRRSMLILEGIHGLNDRLTPKIERSMKFKLYISALTQLNLDDHNRIPAGDNRILRRMVRDYQFRGAGAERTLQMWPNVEKGAWKHIFTF